MRHTRSAKLLSIFLLATAGVGTVARPAAAQVQAARAGRDLTLAVGEQLLVPAEGISQFSVANEGIVDVRVPSDRRNLVVVGQRAGATSLWPITRAAGMACRAMIPSDKSRTAFICMAGKAR